MFCPELIYIVGSYDLVEKGAAVEQINVRPECSLSLDALRVIAVGKDESITSMLQGGNGFPVRNWYNHLAEVQYDLGCTQERRDFRANTIWARDLTQALADRRRGRLNG